MNLEIKKNQTNTMLDTRLDADILSQAQETTVNDALSPILDGIWDNLDPRNRGLKDYSKEKTFQSAYARAKKELGDKQKFLRNGNRYMVDILNDNRMSVEKQNQNFWREYKNYLTNTYGNNEIAKRYNDALDLHYTYGNPKINLLSDDDAKAVKNQTTYSATLHGGRSNFVAETNEMNIFYNYDGKFSAKTLVENYLAELLHARQLSDLGLEEFYRRQGADIKRNNISSGDMNAYDKKMYTDPNSIEGVHVWQGPAMEKRYARDYALEEDEDHKEERLEILNTYAQQYKHREFKPYENQGVIRIIQRALAEQGYELSSLKADETFDGIWGNETRDAFINWTKTQ